MFPVMCCMVIMHQRAVIACMTSCNLMNIPHIECCMPMYTRRDATARHSTPRLAKHSHCKHQNQQRAQLEQGHFVSSLLNTVQVCYIYRITSGGHSASRPLAAICTWNVWVFLTVAVGMHHVDPCTHTVGLKSP